MRQGWEGRSFTGSPAGGVEMWRAESPVCIEPRVVEDDVEGSVAKRPAGRIEVEFADPARHPVHRLPFIDIEPQRVIPQLIGGCPELCRMFSSRKRSRSCPSWLTVMQAARTSAGRPFDRPGRADRHSADCFPRRRSAGSAVHPSHRRRPHAPRGSGAATRVRVA
jgi:hypothetical protein